MKLLPADRQRRIDLILGMLVLLVVVNLVVAVVLMIQLRSRDDTLDQLTSDVDDISVIIEDTRQAAEQTRQVAIGLSDAAAQIQQSTIGEEVRVRLNEGLDTLDRIVNYLCAHDPQPELDCPTGIP